MTDAAIPAMVWEGRSITYWLEQWRIPELHVFTVVGSTNDVAHACAAAGAPAGTLVLAERQTAGRGRFGRRWDAPPGSSVLLSCLLRPRSARDAVPGTIPLRVGIAAAAAVEAISDTRVALKWPNDLVLPGAGKLGGILCEAVATGNTWSVVAGVGINLRAREWPPELRGIATSLDGVNGVATDRAALVGALIDRLRPLFTAPLVPLSDAEVDAFRNRDALAGRAIVVEDEPTSKTALASTAPVLGGRVGVGAGVAPDGALLLHAGGGIERITTGTVRFADSHGQRSSTTAYP